MKQTFNTSQFLKEIGISDKRTALPIMKLLNMAEQKEFSENDIHRFKVYYQIQKENGWTNKEIDKLKSYAEQNLSAIELKIQNAITTDTTPLDNSTTQPSPSNSDNSIDSSLSFFLKDIAQKAEADAEIMASFYPEIYRQKLKEAMSSTEYRHHFSEIMQEELKQRQQALNTFVQIVREEIKQKNQLTAKEIPLSLDSNNQFLLEEEKE